VSALKLLISLLLAVTATPSPTPANSTAAAKSRSEFLVRVDAALASRDAKGLEVLADVASWREAGYPELATLKMLLPEGPLTRYKDLSDTSVLYRDGSGRSWCLRLRPPGESGAWKAVIRAIPCPRGGARAAPQWKPGLKETPATSVWTLLECWPLPV
jgi:hypothetical protein